MNYLVILSLVFLSACGGKGLAGNTPKNGANKDLAQLFDRYWEERMRLYPIEATQNGDNRYNDRLHIDISAPFRDTLRRFYGKYLDGINKFVREDLAENDRISYDIFRREMEMQLEGLRYNEHFIPFQQFWGLPLTMGQLGSGQSSQPFKTADDYRAWLSRAKVFAAWADTAIANFRRGADLGLVLPRPLVMKMIPQMRDMANPDTAKNVFFGPLRGMPKGMVGNDSLKRVFTETITTYVLPAYQRLGDFLQNEYLPRARTTTGIAATPGGAERYGYLVRYWTTTGKTAEEIYQTGLAEVKRIRGEMERVKSEVGFKGDLDAFFNQVRNDPRLMPYSTAEEVLNAFRAIRQKIDPNLDKMFGRSPRTAFEIRQTEAFRAASASAEYQQGTPDGSRPGIFYIPILDATKFNVTSGMESLFLHEAIPGHHYQISLQQENESLPRFRRFAWYGAYGEGWALYTESLGKELGLYTDPYQYMGALGDEIHRAIRLVVDVGMHTKGMTREEAVKYMMDNEAISQEGAVAEIERYMAIPGQALSYKIGALKIWELRNKYTKQLGKEFKLSEFHDEFLKDGGMPLEVVERKMDAWADHRLRRS
ncbi:MAG TPA: DUF885 domain-containing protein [Chitinophagaceae bacterium]